MKETVLRPIIDVLQTYQPIDLLAMDAVKLMDRMDTKYVLNLDQCQKLLQQMAQKYAVLDIDQMRLIPYQSEYFDTPALLCYHQNHAGKYSRQKVRLRTYGNSGQRFFELKTKNNKGRTIKKRVEQQAHTAWQHNPQNVELLEQNSNMLLQNLTPQVHIAYQRCTLVDLQGQARITFDFGLNFWAENQAKSAIFEDLVIIEIKQNKIANNAVASWLKTQGIRPGSINKYCLGMISLHPTLKKNRFKNRYLQLLKKTYNDTPSVA
jgi:hypothetical protein